MLEVSQSGTSVMNKSKVMLTIYMNRAVSLKAVKNELLLKTYTFYWTQQ